jgi:RNA polymerase sigma-70 factor (ECF subfamily)
MEKEPHAVPPSEAEHDYREFAGGSSANLGGGASAETEAVRRREAFARLFAKHDRWLYSYLVTLLGSTAHAEEVFQEVCVVLWREYETFELGTDFVKWVAVIAHNQVRKFRRQRKHGGFQLDEMTFDLLAAEAVERVDLFDYRRDALRRCLTKLPATDRALVEECYQEHKVNFKATALRLGRPENTVYKALNRIRRVLFECINRTLVSDGLL